MATFENKQFANSKVVVDGQQFVNCVFVNCTLIYRGGDLPEFIRCNFQSSNIQLERQAAQTIVYLRGLYDMGLGGLADAVARDVREGALSQSQRPLPPPPENLGTHYGRLAIYAGVIIGIVALFLFVQWTGTVTYPYERVLDDPDVIEPLREEVPLSIMPVLPDSLAEAYDQLHADQTAELIEYRTVDEAEGIIRIPLNQAVTILVNDGPPTWGEPSITLSEIEGLRNAFDDPDILPQDVKDAYGEQNAAIDAANGDGADATTTDDAMDGASDAGDDASGDASGDVESSEE